MSHKHLYDYLSPSLQAHLEEAGDLPSQDRAKLATDMRRTLSSYAAYIPYQLVQKQLANPQPGRIHGAFWEGSMLFADLSGFTRFCDKLSVLGKQGAEEVSSVINQLFTSLVTEIMAYQGDLVAYNGELLKFGGDALTAFFNADTLGPVHAAAATLAAIGMQERMASFAHVETRVGTFRLGLRIGVHSGEVFAAEVGDTSHMELIVTGTDVNRVAIAQKMAVPGEVVISDQTALWLEGARLLPKKPGFYKVLSLSGVTLPPPPEPLPNDDANDIATLENLALQIAALRPYLLRDLPLRYLDDRITELGEFRPVSVLFAHFHDFSTLIPRFGTEAMLAATALNAYYRRVQDIVHQYDGIINKVDMHTYGDKIMALFGAPTAHEDDPLRAVRCAMELEKALREANIEIAGLLLSIASDYIATLQYAEDDSPIILQQRVGINTGTVFAGRVGGVQRHEYTVMGPAVNMAARLMEVANNNTILLSPATRNAVERYITVVEQTPVYVKGVAEPIVPVQVTGEQEMSISSQSASVSRAPLIGRDTEMAFLLAEAKQALRDTGRVLVIVGDVGLGKTRLAEELSRQLVLASVSFEPSNAIPSFQICTGEGQNLKQSIPYITLRTPLRQVLGLNKRQGDTTAESEPESLSFQMQRRVEQLAPEFSHFLPLLGDILGIQLIETPLTRSLSPEQRHHRLQEFVNAIFIGAALHEPLMLFVDDLQWADISSLHVFARLSESATQVPMLLVLCYRSSATIAEPWMKLPHTIRQDLQELSSQQSLDLLHAMLNGSPPPEMLALVERTQGNPFFIEELVRTLVASGTLARNNDGAWHLTCPPDQVAVPSSIEGLITSRLDQLDEPYHEIVQVASIIGQRFQVPILEGVYRKPEMLPYGLQYLQDIDLIISDDPNDQHTYHFRHALLHNVAYESILYSQRRDLHRRVAQRIETLNTGHLDEHLALLTRHYLLAEDWEPAFRYHLEAGIQAKQRYANEEALVLFTTAQDIATRLYQNNGNNDPSPLEDMRPEPGTGSANMSQVVVQTPLHAPLQPLPWNWSRSTNIAATFPCSWANMTKPEHPTNTPSPCSTRTPENTSSARKPTLIW